jgi:hypothetical protein
VTGKTDNFAAGFSRSFYGCICGTIIYYDRFYRIDTGNLLWYGFNHFLDGFFFVIAGNLDNKFHSMYLKSHYIIKAGEDQYRYKRQGVTVEDTTGFQQT